jgi:PAS domain S-box-containing protein
MIEGSAVAAVVTNPRLADNPIVACNRAFEELTGYREAEVLGRNCRFLAGARAEPLLAREIRGAVEEKRPLIAEIPNFKKDGTPFRNAVVIMPIYDAAGQLLYFFGSQSEVPSGAAGSDPSDDDGTRRCRLGQLTPRQREVLHSVVGGKRSKEIARELGITERTVKMHRAGMLAVLGVKTSADAIRLAVESEWHLTAA